LSREEAAQQRGKKLLQAVAGIRPGSAATASWGVIRHQKGPWCSQAGQREGDAGSWAPPRRWRHVTGTRPLCDAQAHHPAIHDRAV